MDPYKVLGVPKNFTMEQLRAKYKTLARRLHPDKTGTNDDYLFKMVTECFKTLKAEHERRQSDKPFNELREGCSSYMTQQNGLKPNVQDFKVGSGKSFNQDKFNQIFEEFRMQNPEDTGYGDWMARSSKNREDIDIKNVMGQKGYSQERFNKMFDKVKCPNERKMIVFKEPEPIVASNKLSFAEIGHDKIDDFSGDNLTTKHLNYTDYKIAHTTTRLVNPSQVNKRKEYNNIHDIEADRSSANALKMSEQDYAEYMKRQQIQKRNEEIRQRNLRQYDDQVARQYAKLNSFMLGR